MLAKYALENGCYAIIATLPPPAQAEVETLFIHVSKYVSSGEQSCDLRPSSTALGRAMAKLPDSQVEIAAKHPKAGSEEYT